MDRAFASSRSSKPVVLEPKRADDERQCEPLPDEGREDHREGQEEDQVAAGKRRACVGLQRQRQRCRERHRTAHAGPREERRAPPVRHPARDPLRQVQNCEHPREAHGDHREADERGVAEELRRRDVLERVHDDGKLQPDEHEQEGVEEVLDDLPHSHPLQASSGGRELRRVPAEIDAGRDGGENPGEAHQIGGQEREVAREERDRDLRGWVVEPTAHRTHDPAHGKPDGNAAARAHDEEPCCVPLGEGARENGRHGDPICDEPGAVVHEALSLDDGHEFPRHPEPSRDGRCGERICR